MKKFIACLLMLVLCVTVFAACSGNEEAPVTSDLDAAKDYLHAMYKDVAVVTPSDYKVTGVVTISGVTYEVTWTAEITSGDKEGVKIVVGDDKMVTVDVNEQAAEEIVYKLTATIKDADGKTATVSFDHSVPAFKVTAWEEYVNAEKGANLVIEGVVTGVMSKTNGNSNNALYVQDTNGGYYIYGIAADPVEEGIEVGMKIQATGKKDVYNGTLELVEASVKIVDSNKVNVEPVDFTERFQKAESLKDESLTKQQGMLVTLKGVEITGKGDNGYYKFKLGNFETYVRISSSMCPLTKEELKTFESIHEEHFGWTADVTGVICVYDGAFYLTPVSVNAFNPLNQVEKTDAEKVAYEKGQLKLPSNIASATSITLPQVGTNYDTVSIAWASKSEYAVVKDGKLVITMPKEDSTVKVTATVTCGDATETVEFEIKLIARQMSYEEIVDAAYNLPAGEALDGTYKLCGTIISIPSEYSEKYKNVTVVIQIGDKKDKPIECFRMEGEGVKDLKVGDKITVEGILKNYVNKDGKSKIEFDSKCKFIGKEEAAVVDQTKVVEAAYALAPGESMSEPSELKGVITKVNTEWNGEHNNITVTIVVNGMTDKPIVCFRLKGEGAKDLKVGDEITVFGTLMNYVNKEGKSKIEFDAGCQLVSVEKAG